MKTILCSTAVDSSVKMAATIAGTVFASNNPALVAEILPVADSIKASIDSGTDQAAINTAFQTAVSDLMPHLSGNPVVLAAVQGVLTSIQFVGGATPEVLEVQVIKDCVDGFVAGLQAPAK